MAGKKFMVILTLIFLSLLFISVVADFFSIWLFFGLLLLGFMYLFGYLYVINYYLGMEDRDAELNANKKKFDWCWTRVNEMLRRMPGGQGLEWRRGIGRQSEYRTYYDGIIHKPFRSLMGYLAETQQLVIIIYDIDGDDIVRFYADPDPEVIENHFHNFKPFQQKSGLSSGFDPRRRSGYSSRYPRRSRGVNLHIGGDDFDDFDSMPNSLKADDKTVDDAIAKLKRDK